MNDGTSSRTVTRCRRTHASSSTGSETFSRDATHTVPPTVSTVSACQTDTSNDNGAVNPTTSSGPSARSTLFAAMWFSSPPSVTRPNSATPVAVVAWATLSWRRWAWWSEE